MHRHSRTIITACNKCCCRGFGTASQLKVKPGINESSSDTSHSLPPAKTWARPSAAAPSHPSQQASVQASTRNSPLPTQNNERASVPQTPSSSRQAPLQERTRDTPLLARNWGRPSSPASAAPSQQAPLQVSTRDTPLLARNWTRPSAPVSYPPSQQVPLQTSTTDTPLPARNWTGPSPPASAAPSQQAPLQESSRDTPLPARKWTRPSPPASAAPPQQVPLQAGTTDTPLPTRNWTRPSALATATPSHQDRAPLQESTRDTPLPARNWARPSAPASSPPSQQVPPQAGTTDTPLPARNWTRPSSPASSPPLQKTLPQISIKDSSVASKSLVQPSAPSPSSSQQASPTTVVTPVPKNSPNKWKRPDNLDASHRPNDPKETSSSLRISASRVSPPPHRRDGASQSSALSKHPLPGQQVNQTSQTNDSTQRPLNGANSRQEPLRTTAKPLIKKLKPTPKKARSGARRKNVYIPTTLTVATLSKLLKVKLDYLLSKMRQVGMAQEATYDYILTSDYAMLLADELGYNPIIDDDAAFDLHAPPPHPNPSSLASRPPIVTIMGHVDHGKTTLLDTLRSASVAKGEAGGITQHIGAFSVPVSQNHNSSSGSQTITFLDTPGHAAFSAMRARGADVTDIVVLVVAADDGIMPQTKEVINLLKREGSHVSLVVAINKVDKPGADVDSVKKALMVEGVQLEDFGGDAPSIEVSGLTGQGLPDLVETLSAVAEMQDLRAEQDGPVFGHILESNFNKGLGPVATVLVQRGCLKVGARVISGLSQGKVRLMTDSNGKAVKVAIPGMAVTVSGWKTLPKAGDEVLEGSESDIKKALANRITMAEKEALHEDIEAINSSRKLDRDARAAAAAAETDNRHPAHDIAPSESETGPKELKLIIKADVSGSSEALEGALDSIGNNIAISKVMSTGVGDITESDVMMAKVANATILGFSVSAPRIVQNLAAQNGVPIFTSNIIYRLVEDVRERIVSMLPKIIETKVVGEATVLQLFEIQLKSKQTAKVAGCRVTNGNVEKQKFARVVRDGEIIYEGSLDTMRHLKKEITEARKGMECGLSLKDFSDLREGDMIQMYEKIEKPGIL